MSEKKSITIMHVADYLPPFHDHIGGAEKAAWDFSRLTHEYNNLRSVYLTSHPVKGKERQNNVSVLTRRAEDFLPEKIGKYIQAAKWYSWQRDPFALRIQRRLS